MGIISFLILSAKKTKAMNRAAKLMLNPCLSSFQAILSHQEKIDRAFDALFRAMNSMPGFSDILKKYNATSSDLEKIASRTHLAGFSFADNGDYIPVAVVSFGRPLEYVLMNEDKILNYSYKEVSEVIENAIPLL